MTTSIEDPCAGLDVPPVSEHPSLLERALRGAIKDALEMRPPEGLLCPHCGGRLHGEGEAAAEMLRELLREPDGARSTEYGAHCVFR